MTARPQDDRYKTVGFLAWAAVGTILVALTWNWAGGAVGALCGFAYSLTIGWFMEQASRLLDRGRR